MSEHIEVTRVGAVQVLRMNRPEKKNAITRAMYAAMAAALRNAEGDDAIRAHVLVGMPGAFCAGNDLTDFMAVATGAEAGNEVFDLLETVARLRKPLLSGVDGIAVGIGTTINLHCDLTFATPQTVFRTPFVDLGLVPEAGSSLLVPAAIGRQRAFALLVLGERLSAHDAKAAGLIHAVVETADLEPTVLATAERLAQKPAEALRLSRDLLLGDRDVLVARIHAEADEFRTRLRSDETRAALVAFMGRKKG